MADKWKMQVEKVNVGVWYTFFRNMLFCSQAIIYIDTIVSSYDVCLIDNATQIYLEEMVFKLNKRDEWPPQSPDCNPMEYSIWDVLYEKVYNGRTKHSLRMNSEP